MSILSLALYGSRARNDHTQNSDTDLFAITSETEYRMIVEGKTNIACYPKDQAFARSEGGDLFFMHIVSEGVPLYDINSDFKEMKNRFQFKGSYSQEIEAASSLGYALLLNQKRTHNFLFFNRRLIWCIRTTLIARAAELKRPVFSASDLAELFDDKRIIEIIDIKSSPVYEKHVYSLALEVLSKHGAASPSDIPSDYNELVSYFESRSNIFGAKTASLLAKDVDTGEYEWM